MRVCVGTGRRRRELRRVQRRGERRRRWRRQVRGEQAWQWVLRPIGLSRTRPHTRAHTLARTHTQTDPPTRWRAHTQTHIRRPRSMPLCGSRVSYADGPVGGCSVQLFRMSGKQVAARDGRRSCNPSMHAGARVTVSEPFSLGSSKHVLGSRSRRPRVRRRTASSSRRTRLSTRPPVGARRRPSQRSRGLSRRSAHGYPQMPALCSAAPFA